MALRAKLTEHKAFRPAFHHLNASNVKLRQEEMFLYAWAVN